MADDTHTRNLGELLVCYSFLDAVVVVHSIVPLTTHLALPKSLPSGPLHVVHQFPDYQM